MRSLPLYMAPLPRGGNSRMKKQRISALLAMLAVCVTLAGPCAAAEDDEIWKEISQMTLREKVGQLFVIRPDALEGRFSAAELEDNSILGTVMVTDEMRDMYRQYPCGGFCIFRKNIVDDDQLYTLTEGLHSLGSITPVLCIDEEGGRVARIGNHPAFRVPKYPSMEKIGQTGDPQQAYDAAAGIGRYLKEFGLDVNFAPVADVNTNPLNQVIGDRSFGSDPEKAAVMGQAYLDGLHSAGIAGCLKHFPGHGDTSNDTHTGYAETGKTWEELLHCEMIPFIAGIQAQADMVMTAHIAAPMVTGSKEPSTVSYTILTEKLRGELGYQGLIVTDALSMGAITKAYSSVEGSVRCLQAGADVILMPYHYQEAFEGVLQAVQNGILTEERINESVEKIFRLKKKLGLMP